MRKVITLVVEVACGVQQLLIFIEQYLLLKKLWKQ